jgi:hypothetical protein
MNVPDELVKRMLDMLETNQLYLDGYIDLMGTRSGSIFTRAEVDAHLTEMWTLRWDINEQTRKVDE